MSSTLELLRAELEAQNAEAARPPFRDVDATRTLIATEKPAATTNITLEMCWLGAKEYDKFWRAELINLSDERDFEAVSALYKSLDPARRSKFTFVLKIWKNYNPALNIISYRVGFSYRIEKVHSLQLSYGNPMGSMQIRERLQAAPLPPPGFPAFRQVQNPTDEVRSVVTSTSSAPDVRARMTSSPQEAVATAVNIPTDSAIGAVVTVKTPSKRKTRTGDGKEAAKVADFESPTKKTRKSCAKELVFTSP